MATIRTRKRESPFVQIDKNIFNDPDISWKAKGILGYLLSKPDDWITYIKDVENHATDGRESVRSGINELIEHGYMERKTIRDKDGKFKGYEYIVHEFPCRLSEVGKPDIGEPDIGKHDTTNNELTNKEVTNKELKIPYVEIINYLNHAAGKNYRPSTNKTKSLIKARWNEGFRLDDFKKVIDTKVADWSNDPKMKNYIRPETLFSPKFEGYLNQTSASIDDDPYEYGF